jgi:hypothetical protein
VLEVFKIMAGLVALAIALVVRFTHPELTETQLFLEYWPYWLLGAFVLLVLELLPSNEGSCPNMRG